jgi:hypothetical protein
MDNTRQIGQVIAEGMDSGLASDLFHSIVESDEVTAQQFDALTAMCPCQLQANAGEAALPTELFFARDLHHDPEAMPRRRTLHSIIS